MQPIVNDIFKQFDAVLKERAVLFRCMKSPLDF